MSREVSRSFRSHDGVFTGLSADALAALATVNSDLSVILSAEGDVLDVAYRDPGIAAWAADDWIGRPWSETVTVESRDKIAELLTESREASPTRSRQVNHPGPSRPDLPIGYRVVSFPDSPYRIAFGSDLRAMAEMQQRLVAAYVEMERDYRKLRDIESRYRVLFHLALEALVVVDAQSLKILDVNDGAARLLARPVAGLSGLAAATLFSRKDQAMAAEALRAAGNRASAGVFRAKLRGSDLPMTIGVTPFRELGRTILLVRLTGDGASGSEATIVPADPMISVVENLPEAMVIVDAQGHIRQANPAFLDLVRVVSPERIEGKGLDTWLGGSGVDLQVLMSNLREHGTMRRFSSIVRDALGGTQLVEVSAAAITTAEEKLFGFSIRETARPEATAVAPGQAAGMPLTDLVGRVPLKNLVRDTADIIEKLCIEAALRLTDNNRASAADMLGLSRQSLYIKLRRFGIVDGDPADEA